VNAPVDWWETFFADLAVDFWRAVIPESATAEDVAFLWKHLRLSAGSRVLDVPCGAGRLARPLAAGGCAVTGVDISPQFLAAAREGQREGGGSVRFRQAEMRDLPWPGEFDAAFCFGNSFGYLDDAGNAAFLHAVARTLKPGGLFALDYGQTAESVLPRITPRQEADMAGFHFAEDTRYDPLTARIENVFTFSRGGRSETKLASQRVYTLSELLRLLADAGLNAGRFFGSPAEDPFELGSPRLLLVAEKPGPGA
jgi:SAM-dependent methyltransferase